MTVTERRGRRVVLPGLLVLMFVVGLVLVVGSFWGPPPPADAPARSGPAQVEAPPVRQTVALPLGASATARLRVPSIGLDSGPPMRLDLRADNGLQVPPDARTVGWYGRASSPGQNGPTVYAAHVDWKGEKGAFYALRRVEAGDEVIVDRADGVTVEYTVDRVDVVSKDDFPTVPVYGPAPDPLIRLVTCGGTFDRSARSYRDNVIVYGRVTQAYRAS